MSCLSSAGSANYIRRSGISLCLHPLPSAALASGTCMQAVELAVSRAVPIERPREPLRRLQSMRQTAAKAGSMVLGAGRFSAKVRAPDSHRTED